MSVDPRHSHPYQDVYGKGADLKGNPAAGQQAEPHRGGLLLAIALSGLVLLLFPWVFPLCGLVMLPISLGIAGCCFWLARADLRAMSGGGMDRAGEGLTTAAMVIGLVNLVLGCIAAVVVTLVLLFFASVFGLAFGAAAAFF